MEKLKNRWLIAASAVGIHISIGSVYAYSVWKLPLEHAYGWSKTEVSLAFSLAILFLGLSAAFLGRFVERRGPRSGGRLAALFFGLGLLGAAGATALRSLPLFYLTYGVISGIGLGVGYISPVSTLVKWFPDRRGLATGLAIMGFGFGALLAGPVIKVLIDAVGVPATFAVLGSFYLALMLASAQYLEPPPEGWMPDGMKAAVDSGRQKPARDLAQLTAREALGTRRFYYLWLMLFFNVTCGIAVISVASPMGQEIAGMSATAAAVMVGLMGLFNGLGRIGWASLSDYIGRPNTYVAFFAIQIVAFLLLPVTSNALLFQGLVFLILTCYGGGFSSVPAYIGDIFGTKQLAAIHGYILTAWAAAGVVGPVLASTVRQSTGSYAGTLYIFGGVFVVALATSLLIQVDLRLLRSEREGELARQAS